jgi:hypothetical protein
MLKISKEKKKKKLYIINKFYINCLLNLKGS